MIAQVLTSWVLADPAGASPRARANHPAILDDLPGIASCNDVTGQAGLPPAPNVLVVEITCTPEILDAIDAHADYGPEAVLWADEE